MEKAKAEIRGSATILPHPPGLQTHPGYEMLRSPISIR